jgi:lipoic acid synthetase
VDQDAAGEGEIEPAVLERQVERVALDAFLEEDDPSSYRAYKRAYKRLFGSAEPPSFGIMVPGVASRGLATGLPWSTGGIPPDDTTNTYRAAGDSLATLGVPVALGVAVGVSDGDSDAVGEPGELTRDELLDVFADLLDHGVDFLTLGQYLQPTLDSLPVERYVPPEEFDELGGLARRMGFRKVASGPLVRSSYHARDMADDVSASP